MGKDSEFKKFGNSYRRGWAYAELGFQYGAAIIICGLLGYWLDSYLGTGGLFLIIGVIIGATAGFIRLLKSLNIFDFRRKRDANKRG